MRPVFRPKQAFILYAVLLGCFTGLYLVGLELARPEAQNPGNEIAPPPTAPVEEDAAGGSKVEVFDDLGDISAESPPETGSESDAIGEAMEGSPDLPPTGVEIPSEPEAPVGSSETSAQPTAAPPPIEVTPELDREAEPRVPSPGETRYTIQVAAYSTRQEAEQHLLRLEAKEFVGRVRPPAGSGDRYYRVWVGDFASREEARVLEEQLKGAGFLTYLRKIE